MSVPTDACSASGQVYAASLTPCTSALEIDHPRLAAHIQWLFANGCSGVAFMGTTGEANSFGTLQRMRALDELLAAGISADRLMVGTGCCSISETLQLTRHALNCGVTDILMLPPFYYKQVTADGLATYFDQVIQSIASSKMKVYLYHFPQMSQMPFPDAVLDCLLSDYPQTIAGMKDSSGDWTHMAHVIRNYPALRLFSGTERHLLKVLRAGGAGCITATANVLSPMAARVVAHKASIHAHKLQDELTQARSIIEAYPMIAALKALQARRTGDPSWLNLLPPNRALSQDDAQQMFSRLDKLELVA